MSRYDELTYRPFAFTPDGYQRLGGAVERLSPDELIAEHERLREEFSAVLPENIRMALEDLDDISYQASQNHAESVIDELCRQRRVPT